MMINIKDLFESIPKSILGNQKKINIKSPLKVYYGLSREGSYRVSFLSSVRPFSIESTKLIKVLQLNESENVYWTCFDLLDSNAEETYYTLIEDLLMSFNGIEDETDCLKAIKNRFLVWKKMLGRTSNSGISEDKARGLFGELYFLKNYLFDKYGKEQAIKSWGAPEGNPKDFTVNDYWYEVKTLGTSVNEVEISSITQLDSENEGQLALIRLEKMSQTTDGPDSCVESLVNSILNSLNDLELKDLFLAKLDREKYSAIDENCKLKFKAHGITRYLVNDSFPRIKAGDIKYVEITDVKYSLFVNALDNFKVVD